MFTKDKRFYQEFFSLLWILAFQNMIVLAVNLVGGVMLGSLNDPVAVTGAHTVNRIQFLLQSIVLGTGDALVVIGSQYWGQRRLEPIKKLTGAATWVSLGFALLLFVLVSLFPQESIRIFTSDEGQIQAGIRYLAIIRFTFPVFALTSVLLASLRSVQVVKIAFWISLSTLCVGTGLNYILIFGRFGAPRLGIVGAGIGTLVARCIELVIAALYVFRADDRLRLRLRDFVSVDRAAFTAYIRVAAPIVLVMGLWGIHNMLQMSILGHMPQDPDRVALAADAAASTLMQLLKVASTGAAAAASIIIGKSVGEGDMGRVKSYAKTLQVIFLCISALTFLSLFLLRGPFLRLYGSFDEATHNMANSFMLVMCFTAAGMAYQMPTNTGIIRGGGDAVFSMIVDVISVWAIVLPISYLAAFKFQWSPVLVVICLNADQVFKVIPIGIKCNRYTWIKKLAQ